MAQRCAENSELLLEKEFEVFFTVHLDMLVWSEELQKDLQVCDTTWLVSKLHKVLEHQLKRQSCKASI